MKHTPPFLAQRIAGYSVSVHDRDAVLGDLEERFQHRASIDPAAARRWYWLQAFGLLGAVVPTRIAKALPHLLIPGTLRFASRALVRSPVSSLVTVTTLSIGVAAPTSMFGLWSGVVGNLPGDPDGTVVDVSVVDRRTGWEVGVSSDLAMAWSQNAVGAQGPFQELAVYASDRVAVGGGEGPPSRYRGAYVTPSLFSMLDQAPILGRFFEEQEATRTGSPAVVLREDVWRERFAGSQSAIGSYLRIDGVDHVVTGVVPESFGFPSNHVMWMAAGTRADRSWSVAGRLLDGALERSARDQLRSTLIGLQSETSSGEELHEVRIRPFTEAAFGNDRQGILAVTVLAGILLLIASVNVASVMLARGSVRAADTNVRMALGASRGQVMSQSFAEAGLLVLVGAGSGLWLGQVVLGQAVGLIVRTGGNLPYWASFELGWRPVAFAAALSALAFFVSGILPAIRTSKTDLRNALGSRGVAAGGSVRLMTMLVGVEVLLSCTLLMVSGLIIRVAVADAMDADVFSQADVLTGRIVLEDFDYPTLADRERFVTQLREGLSSEATLSGVSFMTHLPGKEADYLEVGITGLDEVGADLPRTQVRSVDPEFFSMMELDALTGRLVDSSDLPGTALVAVVNSLFVEERLGGRDAVGTRLRMSEDVWTGSEWVVEDQEVTVVGVVDDRGATPGDAFGNGPGVYLAFDQAVPEAVRIMSRRTGDASALATWTDAIGLIDPNLPLGEVMSLARVIERDKRGNTLLLYIFSVLGGFTLLLAVVGLNGVQSFLMSQRTRELGIRRALGAGSSRVLGESLWKGTRPVAIGLLAGSSIGLMLITLMEPTLGVGVKGNTLAFLAVPMVLAMVAILAIWSPTSRASRADPMDVLRDG